MFVAIVARLFAVARVCRRSTDMRDRRYAELIEVPKSFQGSSRYRAERHNVLLLSLVFIEVAFILQINAGCGCSTGTVLFREMEEQINFWLIVKLAQGEE